MKLKLQIPEDTVKVVIKLKSSTKKNLDSLVEYFSDENQTNLTHEVIIEAAIEKLAKSSDYLKYLNKKNSEISNALEKDNQAIQYQVKSSETVSVN